MSGMSVNFIVILSGLLLSIGLYGLASKKGMIRILISIEIILAGVLINLVAFSSLASGGWLVAGRAFAIFAILLAAAEMAIGVGIAIVMERIYGTTNVDERKELKG